MKQIILILMSGLLTSCALSEFQIASAMHPNSKMAKEVYARYRQTASPCAILYGDVQGAWINEILGKNNSYRPWLVERAGFYQLDQKDQLVYLKIDFLQTSPSDAEKAGQLGNLVGCYVRNFGENSLYKYMSLQNLEDLKRLSYLCGGSVNNFDRNNNLYRELYRIDNAQRQTSAKSKGR